MEPYLASTNGLSLPALISTGSSSKTLVPSPGFQLQRVRAWNGSSAQTGADCKIIDRRTATLGFVGALVGMSVGGGRNANAAGRRPPPPPPKEKQDPNLSGVQAKVLASKKRKEAMKELVNKLRLEGKTVEPQTPTETE